MKTGNLWDIFCKVIDNYGDIGVCWRLACGLAARGERVRLWVDDPSALLWMAPVHSERIEVHRWQHPIDTSNLCPGDILLETFGCEIAPEFIAAYAMWKSSRGKKPVWINLEYLSAEAFVARSHGLPSPVMRGPGQGMLKHFFYPGFTKATGGLLREPDLQARQSNFDSAQWLKKHGIEAGTARLFSLFFYAPATLDDFLTQLANADVPTCLLVTPGLASLATQACIRHKNKLNPLWNKREQLTFSYLPSVTQTDFDHLLWSCDLNFVRGEDSLVRALWANKPFVWQIYPQEDQAHHLKLEAFLKTLDAPPSLQAFHRVWNGLIQAPLPALNLPEWQQTATQARANQFKHPDLVTQLMVFASKTH